MYPQEQVTLSLPIVGGCAVFLTKDWSFWESVTCQIPTSLMCIISSNPHNHLRSQDGHCVSYNWWKHWSPERLINLQEFANEWSRDLSAENLTPESMGLFPFYIDAAETSLLASLLPVILFCFCCVPNLWKLGRVQWLPRTWVPWSIKSEWSQLFPGLVVIMKKKKEHKLKMLSRMWWVDCMIIKAVIWEPGQCQMS